jgi:hypothetical protein
MLSYANGGPETLEILCQRSCPWPHFAHQPSQEDLLHYNRIRFRKEDAFFFCRACLATSLALSQE